MVLRDDLRRFKKWSSIVAVVLNSQAVALIVSLGEGGMYFVVSCGLRSLKKVGLVLSIIGSRTSLMVHSLDRSN